MNVLYRILENKFIFNLIQQILAPGMFRNIWKRLNAALEAEIGRTIRVLELGCGTGYFSLDRPAVEYIGTDINGDYFPNPASSRMSYRVMDATRIDFPDASFDLVYSIGLYHHLTDEQTRASLWESLRVLKNGGRIIFIDGIYPTCRLNVLPWLIRRMDRGRHMRTLEQTTEIMRTENLNVTSADTFYFAVTGLQAVLIQIRKL